MSNPGPITFVAVGDLIGKKEGVLEEDGAGERRVLVSPAIYSLLQTDKKKMLENLMVQGPGGRVWIMDLMGEGEEQEAVEGCPADK